MCLVDKQLQLYLLMKVEQVFSNTHFSLEFGNIKHNKSSLVSTVLKNIYTFLCQAI